MRLAAAIGMFDGVHLGHQALVGRVCALAQERSLTAAAFTFDRHPLEIVRPEAAPRLLTSPVSRCRLLAQAGTQIAEALTFDEDMRRLSASEFLSMMHHRHGVDLLLAGFNHRFGRDREGSYDTYRAIGRDIGVEVMLCDEIVEVDGQVVSSSAVRQSLAASNVTEANAMLGRPYSFAGEVTHGRGIGRTIDFPTANIVPDFSRQLVPGVGVYIATAKLGDQAYPAMVNIGHRPTIEGRDDAPLTIEVHLIGWQGDLYGATVALSFLSYLRGERSFPSLAALKAQLLQDRLATINYMQSLCPRQL